MTHSDIAILFDLDGTLIDSSADLAIAANGMLSRLSLPSVTDREVEGWIGHGVTQLVHRCLTRSFDQTAEPALAKTGLAFFRQMYLETGFTSTRLLPGAGKLLDSLALAGFRIGLVTNKDQTPTTAVLKVMHLDQIFDLVVCGDTLAVRKPDPAPLKHALGSLGTSRGWMVGDSETDARSSLAAGLPFIAVRGGYGLPTEMHQLSGPPVLILDSLSELLDDQGNPNEILGRPEAFSP